MVRAWYMNSSDEDQRLEHHLNPPKFISLDQLYKLTGVEYFKIDENRYSTDETLSKLRADRNYTYEDDLVCSKECLPNYEEKLKAFFREHLHADEEIRFVLEGSGYFDVRNKEEKWIRIEVLPGDLVILPAGIYHRFTLDQNNYIRVKRYFIGDPVWKAYDRPADDMNCRKMYLEKMKSITNEE